MRADAAKRKRARSPRPPTAASATRSRRAPATASRRATSRRACSRRPRRSDDPRRRIEGAKELLPKAAAVRPIASSWPSHLRAMASLLRDVELLATGADARALANPDVQPALERLRRRSAASAACARLQRSTGRWWRSSATPASRSWPTGWCCSCELAAHDRVRQAAEPSILPSCR